MWLGFYADFGVDELHIEYIFPVLFEGKSVGFHVCLQALAVASGGKATMEAAFPYPSSCIYAAIVEL